VAGGWHVDQWGDPEIGKWVQSIVGFAVPQLAAENVLNAATRQNIALQDGKIRHPSHEIKGVFAWRKVGLDAVGVITF
jgi:hypothetical protein